MQMREPLVSVGLTTFNRAAMLERSIQSVLTQTHSHLELVVSDNASTDGTRALCESVTMGDERVRYLRHPVNRGPTANFNAALGACQGEFLMLLNDDDWLDPRYIEECLEFLRTHPDYTAAGGRVRFYRGDQVVRVGPSLQLTSHAPARRMSRFYWCTGGDATFYSLRRRDVHDRIGPVRNVIANDTLHSAAFIYLGKYATLDTVYLNRSVAGMSDAWEVVAATHGLPSVHGRHPHVSTFFSALDDIVRGSPAYKPLALPRRVALAIRCAPSLTFRWWRLAPAQRAHKVADRARSLLR